MALYPTSSQHLRTWADAADYMEACVGRMFSWMQAGHVPPATEWVQGGMGEAALYRVDGRLYGPAATGDPCPEAGSAYARWRTWMRACRSFTASPSTAQLEGMYAAWQQVTRAAPPPSPADGPAAAHPMRALQARMDEVLARPLLPVGEVGVVLAQAQDAILADLVERVFAGACGWRGGASERG